MKLKTKPQLIAECYEGCKVNPKIIKKITRKFMRYPEHEFISMIKTDYNINLEPIRKNTYLIN
jgi:hypothetical protein